MLKLILAFVLWAAVGTGLFFALDYFGWPRWWLIVYGFGTMVALLIWAARPKKKPTA